MLDQAEACNSPSKALAVALDVGTNNEELLNDDLYIVSLVRRIASSAEGAACQGYKKRRLRGQQYDDFVDKFVGLVRKHQSKSLLHFEDFVSERRGPRVEADGGAGCLECATLVATVSVSHSPLKTGRI